MNTIKPEQTATTPLPVHFEFTESQRPSSSTITARALRLRCPRCGVGKLFKGMFRMHDRCSQCQFNYQREPGYYLGSVYMNYGLTALTVLFSYMIGTFVLKIPDVYLITGLVLFCLSFPLMAFRYARALWLALDCRMDASVLAEGTRFSEAQEVSTERREH